MGTIWLVGVFRGLGGADKFRGDYYSGHPPRSGPKTNNKGGWVIYGLHGILWATFWLLKSFRLCSWFLCLLFSCDATVVSREVTASLCRHTTTLKEEKRFSSMIATRTIMDSMTTPTQKHQWYPVSLTMSLLLLRNWRSVAAPQFFRLKRWQFSCHFNF